MVNCFFFQASYNLSTVSTSRSKRLLSSIVMIFLCSVVAKWYPVWAFLSAVIANIKKPQRVRISGIYTCSLCFEIFFIPVNICYVQFLKALSIQYYHFSVSYLLKHIILCQSLQNYVFRNSAFVQELSDKFYFASTSQFLAIISSSHKKYPKCFKWSTIYRLLVPSPLPFLLSSAIGKVVNFMSDIEMNMNHLIIQILRGMLVCWSWTYYFVRGFSIFYKYNHW